LTAGSDDKLQACKKLGADVGINYKTEDWVARVKEETDGRGADVILDVMGASYLSKNTESLAVDGRLIVLGLQGGTVRSFGSNKNLRIQRLQGLHRLSSSSLRRLSLTVWYIVPGVRVSVSRF
jgi:NADPH:quinone reductase-like Zn-dependent oxidoreductase